MKLKIKSKFFWASSFIIIIVFSISFVFEVNVIALETKLIQTYENRLEAAKQENEFLIVNSVKKNSLDNTKNLIESLGFEKVEKVYHINTLDGVVVVTK